MNPATIILLSDVARMATELISQHTVAQTEPTAADLAAVADKLYAGIQAHSEAMRRKLEQQGSASAP